MTLNSELLFSMKAPLLPPLDGGTSSAGHLLPILVADGGTFEGPRLSGRIVAGGDWFRMRNDGSGVLDVRLAIQTNDGAYIHLTYGGRLVVPPDLIPQVMDFANAQNVDPAKYYFRSLITFETGHPDYVWLNDVVAVGVGKVGHGGVSYDVHLIK